MDQISVLYCRGDSQRFSDSASANNLLIYAFGGAKFQAFLKATLGLLSSCCFHLTLTQSLVDLESIWISVQVHHYKYYRMIIIALHIHQLIGKAIYRVFRVRPHLSNRSFSLE